MRGQMFRSRGQSDAPTRCPTAILRSLRKNHAFHIIIVGSGTEQLGRENCVCALWVNYAMCGYFPFSRAVSCYITYLVVELLQGKYTAWVKFSFFDFEFFVFIPKRYKIIMKYSFHFQLGLWSNDGNRGLGYKPLYIGTNICFFLYNKIRYSTYIK